MVLKHNIDQINGLETALAAIDQGISLTTDMVDELANCATTIQGRADEYFPAKKSLIIDSNTQLNNNQNIVTAALETKIADIIARVEDVKEADSEALSNSLQAAEDSLNNVAVAFETAKEAVIGGELDEAYDTLGELKDYIEETLDVDVEITEYIDAKKSEFLSSLSGVVEDGLNTLKEIHDAVPVMVTAIETAGDEAQAALDAKVAELRKTLLTIDSFYASSEGAVDGAVVAANLGIAETTELDTAISENEAVVSYETVICTTTDGVTTANFSSDEYVFNAVRELAIAEVDGDLVEVLLIADSSTPGIYEVPAELDGLEITVPTYVKL